MAWRSAVSITSGWLIPIQSRSIWPMLPSLPDRRRRFGHDGAGDGGAAGRRCVGDHDQHAERWIRCSSPWKRWSAVHRRAAFTFLTVVVNIPLVCIDLHPARDYGALAMPLLAPCWPTSRSVSRPLPPSPPGSMGHGLALIIAPTSVVAVGGTGNRQGRLQPVPALRLAAMAGHVRRGDGHNRCGRDPQVIRMAAASPVICPNIIVTSGSNVSGGACAVASLESSLF